MRRGVPERAHRPLQVDGLDNDVICGKRRVDEIQDAVDDAGDPRPVAAALRAVAARSEPGVPSVSCRVRPVAFFGPVTKL